MITTRGPSTKRVLAAWANALADWEEGTQPSLSSDDMLVLYEGIVGKLAVDVHDAFFAKTCDGASLEDLLQFLEECEHAQPLRPAAVRFEVIQVNGRPIWTVLKWENDHCAGGDHHWLSETAARRAHDAYTRFPWLHGKPESVVLEYV